MAPSFTILIPTRDRADTLIYTVRSALAQDYPNFEVLVSDNSASAETRNLLDRVRDSRLRVISTGGGLSMSHHWEFAIRHVETEWLTILGDDDGLLPGSIARVNHIIHTTGAEAIRANGCSYTWPGMSAGRYGKLTVSMKHGYKVVNSRDILAKVIKGRSHYTTLPVLYNGGFVCRSLIDRAKSPTGRLYHCMTPDVYSGIVFALLTESFVLSLEPLAINGASRHSGGTATFEQRKLRRDYDPAEKFFAEPNIPLHSSVPLAKTGKPVRSLQAIVYEAFLQAANVHGNRSGEIATTPAEQLTLILNRGGPDLLELRSWAATFIQHHNLNVGHRSIAFRLKFSGLRSKLEAVLYLVRSLVSEYVFHGNFQSPLMNVYEASCLAGFIKETRPSRILNAARRLRRFVMGCR